MTVEILAIATKIAEELKVKVSQVETAIRLLDDGATVPFIARYRKERTGNLDEVAIQNVIEAKEEWDAIVKRQKYIVSEIDRQGKLSPDLTKLIFSTFRMEELEDIYLPYKQKKKTKATIAKDAGLEPLADILWDLGHGLGELAAQVTLETLAGTFVNAEKGMKDVAAVLAGAQDITINDWVSVVVGQYIHKILYREPIETFLTFISADTLTIRSLPVCKSEIEAYLP